MATTSFDYAAGIANYVPYGSWDHTIGAGSGRLLVVFEVGYLSASSGRKFNSLTFNGASFTLLSTWLAVDNSARDMRIWYLVNPDVGTYAITPVHGGSVGSYPVAISASFFSVDQTNPFRNTGSHTYTDGVWTGSLSVTSCAANDMVLAAVTGNHGTLNRTTGQTNRSDVDANYNITLDTQVAVGATTVLGYSLAVGGATGYGGVALAGPNDVEGDLNSVIPFPELTSGRGGGTLSVSMPMPYTTVYLNTHAELDKYIPFPTLSASGSQDSIASLDVYTPTFTLSSTGSQSEPGYVSFNMPIFTCSAEASIGTEGDTQLYMPFPTLSITAGSGVSFNTPRFTASISGSHNNKGSLDSSLRMWTFSGSGLVGVLGSLGVYGPMSELLITGHNIANGSASVDTPFPVVVVFGTVGGRFASYELRYTR